MNQFSVVQDFNEGRVRNLFPIGIKARCLESDVKGLPLAGWLTRVQARGFSLKAGIVFPPLVNRTAIVRTDLRLAVAV